VRGTERSGRRGRAGTGRRVRGNGRKRKKRKGGECEGRLWKIVKKKRRK